MDPAKSSRRILQKQLAELSRKPSEAFSVELSSNNIYVWNIVMFGQPDTLYEGGLIKATMEFPVEYPAKPPTFRFVTDVWHPNVHKNGYICISILKEQDDELNASAGWATSELWLPVYTAESIIISIMSLLCEDPPSLFSVADLDVARQVREDIEGYRRTVRRVVERSNPASYTSSRPPTRQETNMAYYSSLGVGMHTNPTIATADWGIDRQASRASTSRSPFSSTFRSPSYASSMSRQRFSNMQWQPRYPPGQWQMAGSSRVYYEDPYGRY